MNGLQTRFIKIIYKKKTKKPPHWTRTAHTAAEIHHAYTHYSVLQLTATHTHTHTRTLTHTQGVLSLMAVRSESDKLTSPANTVH